MPRCTFSPPVFAFARRPRSKSEEYFPAKCTREGYEDGKYQATTGSGREGAALYHYHYCHYDISLSLYTYIYIYDIIKTIIIIITYLRRCLDELAVPGPLERLREPDAPHLMIIIIMIILINSIVLCFIKHI